MTVTSSDSRRFPTNFLVKCCRIVFILTDRPPPIHSNIHPSANGVHKTHEWPSAPSLPQLFTIPPLSPTSGRSPSPPFRSRDILRSFPPLSVRKASIRSTRCSPCGSWWPMITWSAVFRGRRYRHGSTRKAPEGFERRSRQEGDPIYQGRGSLCGCRTVQGPNAGPIPECALTHSRMRPFPWDRASPFPYSGARSFPTEKHPPERQALRGMPISSIYLRCRSRIAPRQPDGDAHNICFPSFGQVEEENCIVFLSIGVFGAIIRNLLAMKYYQTLRSYRLVSVRAARSHLQGTAQNQRHPAVLCGPGFDAPERAQSLFNILFKKV